MKVLRNILKILGVLFCLLFVYVLVMFFLGGARKDFRFACDTDNLARAQSAFKTNPFLRHSNNKRGDTALHVACDRAAPKITAWLLTQKGVDVNATNKEGKSPLHLLFDGRNYPISQVEEVLDILLKADADINAKDPAGNTALYYASKGRFDEKPFSVNQKSSTVPCPQSVLAKLGAKQ